MTNMNEFCKKLLAGRPEYTEVRAARIFQQLQSADEDILFAVNSWMEDGSEIDFSERGWNVARLKSELGMNYLAAVLTIDWLRKEPEDAIKALKDGIK